MENFEETVVNPNIRLSDIDGKSQPLIKQNNERQDQLDGQAPNRKLANNFFLFILSVVIVLMVAIFARG